MSFVVNIHDFEGPLDLMLYLIRENKLDLFDLDLVVLCNQYIDFIQRAQDQQLEVAADYLSEMAGLIELKSKRLLPRPPVLDDQEQLNDPTSLVSRLLEYQRFKDATLDLSQRFNQRQTQVNLFKPSLKEFETEVSYSHDIYDLIKAMNKVIARHQSTQMKEITYTKTEYSIDERIDQIRYFLKNKESSFKIEELFDQHHELEFKIVTFLAVLDMILMKEIHFSLQNETITLKGA